MPTMKDVAREAGVAVGTVSKFINGIPVGPLYAERVKQAIQKLNYSVNTYARGLKTQKTGTVAVIVPDVRNSFFSNFAYHVEAALYRRGIKMFLCSSNDERSHVQDYLNMAKQNKADGIIAITYSDIDDIVTEDIPFVSIDRHFSANVPCVASDNYEGGRLAAEKLLECGCKRPFFLRAGSTIYGETNKRWDGFSYGCRLHGIEPGILDIEEPRQSVDVEFHRFLEQRLRHGDLGFDGIFAVTDLIAYKAIGVLRAYGISVPDDVQVVGFDGVHRFNDEGLGYYVSTFRQPIEAMAETSVRILLDKEQVCVRTLTLLPVAYAFGGTTTR